MEVPDKIYTDCKIKVLNYKKEDDYLFWYKSASVYTDEDFGKFVEILENNLYGMPLDNDYKQPDGISNVTYKYLGQDIYLKLSEYDFDFVKEFLQKMLYSHTMMDIISLYNLDERNHARLYTNMRLIPDCYLKYETDIDGIMAKIYFDCYKYEGETIQKVAYNIFNNKKGIENE